MARRIDWNLRMVKARQAMNLLPRDPVGDVNWGSVRVGHLDTGYTEHPVFGDWPNGSTWLRTADGINLREPQQLPLDPLDYEGSPGHGTRTASVLCGDLDPPFTQDGVNSEIGVAPAANGTLSRHQSRGADTGTQSTGRGGRDTPLHQQELPGDQHQSGDAILLSGHRRWPRPGR